MPGSFKTHVKSLRPVSFITFDDTMQWDRESGNLARGNELWDESENGDQINALLHIDDENAVRYSYMLGQNSLVPLQQTDSYSLVLAPYWQDGKNEFPFAKTFLEIPHEDRISFNKSYTVMFLIDKPHSDRSQIGGIIWDNTNKVYRPTGSQWGYNYNDAYRTIFSKGSLYMRYHLPQSGTSSIQFTFPNNSGSLWNNQVPSGSILGQYLFVMTHDYIVMDDGRYYTESKIYMDADLVYSHTSSPVYGDYVAGNTSPMFWGGHQGSWDHNTLNDRTTTPTKFDQITLFDRALTQTEVVDIVKKTYSYENVVIRARPDLYYPFNDQVESTGFTNVLSSGTKRIYQVGSNNDVIKRQPGIHGAYGDTSTRVRDRGMMYSRYVSGNYTGSFFNPGGNFNIEFFGSFVGNDRGVYISVQDDVYPFRGVAMFVNSRDGSQKSGSIQISIDDNTHIHTPEFNARGEPLLYNDGIMRHYSIARKGNTIEFKINTALVGTCYITPGSLTTTNNSLYLFGLLPSDLSVEGYIQHLAFYSNALSDLELDIRVNYISRYMITGRTTINGTGRPILIRVYSFNDGQLLSSQESYSNGEYNIRIPSSDYINVVFQDPKSTKVRPLVIGPTLADEYVDLSTD